MSDSNLLIVVSLGIFSITCLISFLIDRYKSALVTASGKCVLISGCDSGIGQKLSVHLLRQGFVVFAGCLDVDSDLTAPLRNIASDNLYLVKLDITCTDSVCNALSYVRNKLKSRELYGLVNNAGICVYGEFEWLTAEQTTKMVEVNLLGTIRLTKMFLPLIRQAKGRIVTVSSVNGDIVYPGLSVYCATKYALEAMNDALRYELKKFGVFISIIRPGDFAKLTNIMKNHSVHVDEMWAKMNEEQKSIYGNYFHNYHNTSQGGVSKFVYAARAMAIRKMTSLDTPRLATRMVLRNYGMTSYRSMESSPLLTDVRHALLSASPKARYVCAPWYFKIFFIIWKFCPTFLSDRFISALFKIVSDK